MWPLAPQHQPPVPPRLRELLEQYPVLIQRLQRCLNSVVTDPVQGVPPFDVAVWRLTTILDSFLCEARHELSAVEIRADPLAIMRADKKVQLMLTAQAIAKCARHLSELRTFFSGHRAPGFKGSTTARSTNKVRSRKRSRSRGDVYLRHAVGVRWTYTFRDKCHAPLSWNDD